jgi:hypothetical protein
MDRLNQCYGKNTVYFGGAQAALDSSPSPQRLHPRPGAGEATPAGRALIGDRNLARLENRRKFNP